MQLRRSIAGFLIRFALVYGLLILPWPGLNAAYGSYFRALTQTVLSRGGDRILRIEAAPEGHALDTRITVASRKLLDRNGRGPAMVLELDMRAIAWLPVVLVLALILATLIPWRRRGWALLWGGILVHCFVLFSVEIYIWNESDALTGHSLATFFPFWKMVLDGLEETLITQLGASFAVPVLIWILVTFCRQDGVGGSGNPVPFWGSLDVGSCGIPPGGSAAMAGQGDAPLRPGILEQPKSLPLRASGRAR